MSDKNINEVIKELENLRPGSVWAAMPWAYYHPRDATPENPGGWTDGDIDNWCIQELDALPLLVDEIKRLNQELKWTQGS